MERKETTGPCPPFSDTPIFGSNILKVDPRSIPSLLLKHEDSPSISAHFRKETSKRVATNAQWPWAQRAPFFGWLNLKGNPSQKKKKKKKTESTGQLGGRSTAEGVGPSAPSPSRRTSAPCPGKKGTEPRNPPVFGGGSPVKVGPYHHWPLTAPTQHHVGQTGVVCPDSTRRHVVCKPNTHCAMILPSTKMACSWFLGVVNVRKWGCFPSTHHLGGDFDSGEIIRPVKDKLCNWS